MEDDGTGVISLLRGCPQGVVGAYGGHGEADSESDRAAAESSEQSAGGRKPGDDQPTLAAEGSSREEVSPLRKAVCLAPVSQVLLMVGITAGLLENQDSVLSLLRQTESELSLMMLDAMRTQEDPLQRQRLLVEEERLKYLNQEELLIQQLHDLEKSVEELQRNSSVNHGLVTEQDVEQKSKELRMLGETLTELKNQFPSLQSKMRVVLRVEVEAVKFLKEEPHRLDALLKRCNTMTDALSTLRRYTYQTLLR
ncbi:SRC kinase signaling inhibitor 1-like [Morone saxatilis]|uniref:SRC kinase signaling inhibitor 1-like n=1 Tax=Morone saxatilis TaxID=34816 RepID=UPI0015E23CF1|nr:SRC kinase signaling inhibitor 1-like [Morone saxatilis]